MYVQVFFCDLEHSSSTYCTLVPQSPFSRVGGGAVHGPQPWQNHLALAVQVPLGTSVQALHQQLLVEQGVVGPECAGRVVVQLVVVAQLRLPDGWEVFVHVHLTAQGHHEEDSWDGKKMEPDDLHVGSSYWQVVGNDGDQKTLLSRLPTSSEWVYWFMGVGHMKI